MTYADYDDIRRSSDLRIVQDADDDQLARWCDIAKGEIDQFCSRDFTFEEQVPYDYYVTSHLIPLRKEIANITAVTALDVATGEVLGDVDLSEFLIMPTTRRQLRFKRMVRRDMQYPLPALQLTITADWGLALVPEEVTRVFKRLIERIAARSNEDDVLQQHAPYLREDDGDGYSYDRGNPTLRNLLRPEDRAALWKWVSYGRILA